MTAERLDPAMARRDRFIFRTITPVGAVLLILGQVGDRTAIASLPGDPHHIGTRARALRCFCGA